MLRPCVHFGDLPTRVKSTAGAPRRSPTQLSCKGHLGSVFVPTALQPRFRRKGYRLSTQAVSEEGIDVITSTKSSVLMDAISSSPSLESIADPSEVLDKAQQATATTLDTIREPASQAFDAASEAASRAAGATAERASEASKAVDDVLNILQESSSTKVDAVGKGLEDSIQAASGLAESLTSDIETALTQVLSTTDSTLTKVVEEVDNSVPPQVKDFLEPILKHPGESLAAVGFLAAVYVLMSVSQELFSDKSGLEPQDAITILESGEPALLIDLRSELEREESGIPKLRKRAYGKGASVEAFGISKRAGKLLRNSDELEAKITAKYILAQNQASTAASIILMGPGNQDCRPIQNALRRLGCSKVFVLNGGFLGWTNAKLPIDSGEGATYSVGTVDSLTESVQVLTEQSSVLNDPSVYIPLSIVTVLSVWAVVNYHYTLRLVGVFGPFFTAGFLLYRRYQSPQDFMRDVGNGVLFLYKTGKAQISPELGVAGSTQPPQEDTSSQFMDRGVETESDKETIP